VSEDDLRNADPVVQEARLQEIADLHLTDPDVDPELRDIAARAAASLGLPIGVVSIVLDQAQYFAAAHGLGGWLAEVRGNPIEWSFCVNAVRSREPFVVEDALANPLVAQSPLVTQEGVRCYAGIPLITSRGHVIGTLCVAGVERHAFPPDDVDKLRALAAAAVRRIEARRG
jgi:GAF domain-containing protein